MKKALVAVSVAVGSIVLLLLAVIAKHYHDTADIRKMANDSQKSSGDSAIGMSIKLNPITNNVTMRFLKETPSPTSDNNPWSSMTDNFMAGMMQLAVPSLEKAMNDQARKKMDLYAVFVPYHISLKYEEPTKEELAAIQKRREEKKLAEEKLHKDKVQAFLKQGLQLIDVRFGMGEKYGEQKKGAFGTVINNGPKTITKVTVRFYFLDQSGKRIGEDEYCPVLVTSSPFGDNAPLRPGYRKDFGCNLEDKAPSGWADKIEAEIVDVEAE